MHQTAYHRCNRVFYPPMNEDIPGKLFFDLIIFAVFLHYTYFWRFRQIWVVGLVFCSELVVQRSFFHVLVAIGLNRASMPLSCRGRTFRGITALTDTQRGICRSAYGIVWRNSRCVSGQLHRPLQLW